MLKNTVDGICRDWQLVEDYRENLFEISSRRDPQLSLAILSWLRTDKLKKMLTHWINNISFKTNIALMVQEGLSLDKRTKEEIETLCNKFNSYHLEFTEKNMGTGGPRRQMVHEALKFGTPYIMTTDDDMLFPLGLVETQILVHEIFDQTGAVCSWAIPNAAGHIVKNNQILKVRLNPPMMTVDIMGSATMVMKREIFKDVDLDENYFIGWGDFDLCMQLKQAGWKLRVLALPNFRAINDYGGPERYKKFRYRGEHSRNSANLFYKKWGIKIL